MIAIIIPTTSKDLGIETALRIKSRLMPVYDQDIKTVVVVDGGCSNKVSMNNGVSVIETVNIKGSYICRNIGASSVKDCSHYFFVDDGVDVNFSGVIGLDENNIVSGLVSFNREVTDSYEEWYKINAFDNERFLNKFKFLPTIFLIVPKIIFDKIGGFDERLKSSGDVDFCQRAKVHTNILLSSKINIITSLRSEAQIRKKIVRQVTGQVAQASFSQRLPSFYFYILARIVLNIFMLFGVNNITKSSNRVDYLKANSSINLLKVKVLLKCLITSRKNLCIIMDRANAAELGG
jgi:hypothetical protein